MKKNWLEQNWYKILSAVMLIVALGGHPIGYYQILRWVVMVTAGYSAYVAYLFSKVGWVWTFAVVAILFNPISQFYFTKNTWQTIDIITAVIFIVSMGVVFNKHTEKTI